MSIPINLLYNILSNNKQEKYMEEKYFVTNIANDFLIFIRCNEFQLSNYNNFGFNICKDSNGALDLRKLSKWFIAHNICFRAVLLPRMNIFKYVHIIPYVLLFNYDAKHNNSIISKNEIHNLIMEIHNNNTSNCWNF